MFLGRFFEKTRLAKLLVILWAFFSLQKAFALFDHSAADSVEIMSEYGTWISRSIQTSPVRDTLGAVIKAADGSDSTITTDGTVGNRGGYHNPYKFNSGHYPANSFRYEFSTGLIKSNGPSDLFFGAHHTQQPRYPNLFPGNWDFR